MQNTVTDLKNIFTGLEPTHLVSNIFDTVKNAVVHPSTWIKPLEDIASGNVKQGLELAAGITGPGSILSWLPGVYVGGLAAQGGIGNVLSHPVVSLMDVAPFTPAGRILDAATDASRTASIAEKVGMTPSQLPTPPSRAWPNPGFSPARSKTSGFWASGPTPWSIWPPASPSPSPTPWTSGSRPTRAVGKTLSSLMKGMLNINDEGTDYEMALMRPAEMEMQALSPDKQEGSRRLAQPHGPAGEGQEPDPGIETDDTIDPQVKTAYSALAERPPVRETDQGPRLRDRTWPRPTPDGTIGIYHTAGEPSPVVRDGQGAQRAPRTIWSRPE